MDTQDTCVPVTLLTESLGASKTTLLNHLPHDAKTSHIVVSEVEAPDSDHNLFEAPTEETKLIQPGYLCCNFRYPISTKMGSLMTRKMRGVAEKCRLQEHDQRGHDQHNH